MWSFHPLKHLCETFQWMYEFLRFFKTSETPWVQVDVFAKMKKLSPGVFWDIVFMRIRRMLSQSDLDLWPPKSNHCIFEHKWMFARFDEIRGRSWDMTFMRMEMTDNHKKHNASGDNYHRGIKVWIYTKNNLINILIFAFSFIWPNVCWAAFIIHQKQRDCLAKGFINRQKQSLSGHVESCRGIPHTHPAKVTRDSQSSSTDQQIQTQQQPFLRPCGEWNRNAERSQRKRVEKRGRTDLFYLSVMDSLLLPFTSSILHPPLLSEAVTPARCTSLTPHAAFLSPLRSHWLSDSEQRAVDWPQDPLEKEKVKRAGGDQWINAHFWSL